MEAQSNDTFISISEYAKLRGVSVAAVYKRLDGTLKPYTKTINGKKCISKRAFELDGIQQVIEGFQPGLNTVETRQAQDKAEEEATAPADAALLKALEALQNQLSEKDKQIERLQEETADLRRSAAEKDKFIQEQSNRLSLLLEQSQELQRNNQILLGAAQGVKPVPAEHQEAQAEQEPVTATDAPGEKKEKKGFFKWLFG